MCRDLLAEPAEIDYDSFDFCACQPLELLLDQAGSAHFDQGFRGPFRNRPETLALAGGKYHRGHYASSVIEGATRLVTRSAMKSSSAYCGAVSLMYSSVRGMSPRYPGFPSR